MDLDLDSRERSQWAGTSYNFSSSPPCQVQVHLGSASLDLALTRGTWAESAESTSPHSWTYTKGHPVYYMQNLRSVSKSVWWLNLYFSHRDCLYFDFLACSLYFSSIVADLDLWWLNTLYPKVQISMKTLSKALTIQTKQDKQSYLMFCPCGKCLLEAVFFIGPWIALMRGENRNGKIFSFFHLYLYLYLSL